MDNYDILEAIWDFPQIMSSRMQIFWFSIYFIGAPPTEHVVANKSSRANFETVANIQKKWFNILAFVYLRQEIMIIVDLMWERPSRRVVDSNYRKLRS